MTDTLRGKVIDIVDGDTFDLKVTQIGTENKTDYKNIERIRIAEADIQILKKFLESEKNWLC